MNTPSKLISNDEFKDINKDISNLVNDTNKGQSIHKEDIEYFNALHNKTINQTGVVQDKPPIESTTKINKNSEDAIKDSLPNKNAGTDSLDILTSLLNDSTISTPDDLLNINTVGLDIPNETIPNIDIPNIETVKMDIPNIDMPNIDISNMDIPNMDIPSIELSEGVLSSTSKNNNSNDTEETVFEKGIVSDMENMNSLDVLFSNNIILEDTKSSPINENIHEQIIPDSLLNKQLNKENNTTSGLEISFNDIDSNTNTNASDTSKENTCLNIETIDQFNELINDNDNLLKAKELLTSLHNEWDTYRKWWKENYNDGDYNTILEDKNYRNSCNKLLQDLKKLDKQRPYIVIGNIKFYFKPHYIWTNEDYKFDIFTYTDTKHENYSDIKGDTSIDKVYFRELTRERFLNTIFVSNNSLPTRCYRLLYEPIYNYDIYCKIVNLYSSLQIQYDTIKTKLANNEINLSKERAKQLDALQNKKTNAMQQLYKDLEMKKIAIQNKYKEESDRRKAKLNDDIQVEQQEFAKLKSQLLDKHKEALLKFDELIDSANTLDNNLRLLLGDRIYKSLKAYYNENTDISVYDIQCSNDCLEMINGLSDDLYDLIGQQQHNHAKLINKLANLPFTVTDYTKKLIVGDEQTHLNELKGSCVDMLYILIGTYLLIILRLYLLPTAVGTLAIKSVNNTILLSNLKHTYGQFVEVLNNPTKLKERYSELLIQELLGGKQSELDINIDNLKQVYGEEESKAKDRFDKDLRDLTSTFDINSKVVDLERQFNEDKNIINKDFDSQIEDKKLSYTAKLNNLQCDLTKLSYLCKLICHTVLSTPSIDSAVPRNNFIIGEIVNNEFNYKLPLISSFKEGSYAIVYNSNVEGSYDEALNLFRINLFLMTFGVSLDTLVYNIFDTLSGDEIKQSAILRYNTANMYDKPDFEDLLNSNKETIKTLTSDDGVLSAVVNHNYNSLQEYNLELSKSEGAILEKYKFNLFISYELQSIFTKPLSNIILQKPIYGIYNLFLVDKAHVENLIEKSKEESTSSKDNFIDLFNSLLDLVPNVIDITTNEIKLCKAINTSSYATKNSYFSVSEVSIPNNCTINYYSI